jgi:hypothetical protein
VSNQHRRLTSKSLSQRLERLEERIAPLEVRKAWQIIFVDSDGSRKEGPRIEWPARPVGALATGLDVPRRLINECADSDGQHNAARNQVPSPSDTSYDRLPVRRLGGHLARRMDQMPAELSGYGCTRENRTRCGAS